MQQLISKSRKVLMDKLFIFLLNSQIFLSTFEVIFLKPCLFLLLAHPCVLTDVQHVYMCTLSYFSDELHLSVVASFAVASSSFRRKDKSLQAGSKSHQCEP